MANNQTASIEMYPQEDQAPAVNAVSAIFTALSILAVILRIIARRVSHLALWWDDWLLVLALVSSRTTRK